MSSGICLQTKFFFFTFFCTYLAMNCCINIKFLWGDCIKLENKTNGCSVLTITLLSIYQNIKDPGFTEITESWTRFSPKGKAVLFKNICPPSALQKKKKKQSEKLLLLSNSRVMPVCPWCNVQPLVCFHTLYESNRMEKKTHFYTKNVNKIKMAQIYRTPKECYSRQLAFLSLCDKQSYAGIAD